MQRFKDVFITTEQYTSIKKYLLKNGSPEISSTCSFKFYYSQNLPFLKLSVSVASQFYKRLLWLYVFNIHSYEDKNSIFYAYLMFECPNNSVLVAYFLYYFLSEKL